MRTFRTEAYRTGGKGMAMPITELRYPATARAAIRATVVALVSVGIFLAAAPAWAISGDEIIKRVEQNQLHKTEQVEGSLVITDRFGSRTKTFKSSAAGSDRMLIEFTNPEERGQKILRLQNEIYLYFPNADSVIHLQGSALKDSVVGSDFSYEDLTGDNDITKLYDVELLGNESVDGHDSYHLRLTAKSPGVAYPKQEIWVDSSLYVVRKAAYYAVSGTLVKTLQATKVENIGGFNVATDVTMSDAMKKNSSTRFIVSKLVVDAELPANTFSQESLSW